MFGNIDNVMAALRVANNPNEAMQQVLNNPQFQKFYEENKDKTPEQVAQAYGLDIGLVNRIIGVRSR